MPKLSKQEIEKYYFEMFRRDYPLPSGAIEYSDKPDVVLHGERKIGIEITNFFLEDGALRESEQVQRKAREQVVAKAQRIYQRQNGKSFELTFGFDKATPIRNSGDLADKIARLVTRTEGHRTGQIRRDTFRDIPELSFVYLNSKEYDHPQWQVSQVYSTPVMSYGSLKHIVQEKEAKANDYKPCDAYWLLVVIDFIDRAQDQEIRTADLEAISSDVFEKLFIYRTHFGHILEVDSATRAGMATQA